MRRRDVIKAIATSAAAWPFMARAQPNKVRRVGVLLGLSENDPEANARVKAFRLGMRDLEWIEGRNIQIDYRFAGSDLDLIQQTCGGVGQIATRHDCREFHAGDESA